MVGFSEKSSVGTNNWLNVFLYLYIREANFSETELNFETVCVQYHLSVPVFQ